MQRLMSLRKEQILCTLRSLKCVKQKSDMISWIILQSQLLLCGAWTRKHAWKPRDQLRACYTSCILGTKAEKDRGEQIQ